MSRADLLSADNGLQLGSVLIPFWVLGALALLVVLLIVGIVVYRLARRARKLARATDDAAKGAGEDFGGHGFGYFGAVTSAISITPDVSPRSHDTNGSNSDD
ncbi:hypothetical protein BSP239C_00752 [Brevibacterium sp. 239c]|uniref:hypothetical protein n=1 Tax=Brevibacterium sp. 239c TaxID=1965356 RepID=UPI000C53551E|nr:hypothetical protein [Brevibacterium sp. 239c]SMX74094.1 hypothetical protein BSP239C_00752 [Brevibacterium sp. 239c]